jgi:hypothetical protein
LSETWFKMGCSGCGLEVVAPEIAAKRVIDGRSFVLCDACGDEYERATGAVPVARFDARRLKGLGPG